MTRRKTMPVALTIAGSDSGGGAGLQADLQTFASLGVHGTTAVTCVTAQNPRRVIGIEAVSTRLVRQQLEAVFAELGPAACKCGMLYSEGIIECVASFLKSRRDLPLIIDPVMIATSGAALLKPGAIRALRKKLLPVATLITPNVDEAIALTGLSIRNPESLRAAARQLHETFGCAVLAKGGHLQGLHQAIDIYFDGRTELLLSTPYIRGVTTHGTGCTYSAAITAWCARGLELPDAVCRAKEYISSAIEKGATINRHQALNWRAAGTRH